MKILHNIYIAIIVLIVSLSLFVYSFYHYLLSGASSDTTEKEVVIEKGTINQIAVTLKKEGLIKSVTAFKIYVKLSGKNNLKASSYYLSPNMGVKKIIAILSKGNGINHNQLSITFKEGTNIRKMIKIITENTNITEEDFLNTLKDKEFLNQLISDYWFLTEDILDDKIYYSLEGYLYPNTYFLKGKDVTSKELITTLLNETKKQLSPYQEKISTNELRIHEIMTLASIVELEGVSQEDRKGIAGVFMNRLHDKMTLGSDVTTYYGARIDMGERDLSKNEVQECNNYNTRCASFVGLPVSPIDSPSIESIEAVLEPSQTDNYYFVADKNRKIYFSKTITEHNNIINKLKKQGLWYVY